MFVIYNLQNIVNVYVIGKYLGKLQCLFLEKHNVELPKTPDYVKN